MSIFSIILLSFLVIEYIIQTYIIYKRFCEEPENDIWFKIIMYAPIISTTFIIIAISVDLSQQLIERNKLRKRRRIELKEKERKIKLGIIRISDVDPFGEENWN